jgi:hypothetical protein
MKDEKELRGQHLVAAGVVFSFVSFVHFCSILISIVAPVQWGWCKGRLTTETAGRGCDVASFQIFGNNTTSTIDVNMWR